jgi:hypothetical protein
VNYIVPKGFTAEALQAALDEAAQSHGPYDQVQVGPRMPVGPPLIVPPNVVIIPGASRLPGNWGRRMRLVDWLAYQFDRLLTRVERRLEGKEVERP